MSLAAACEVTPGFGTVGGWDRNVSEQGDAWGDYRTQGIYRLQRDVFVLDVPDRTNGRALVAGAEWTLPRGTFQGPVAVSDFQSNPKGYRGIIGVVPADTRIRAEVLRAKGNLRDRSVTRRYVKARVLDGEFRGWMVDLEPLSLYEADTEGGPDRLMGPNEDFLRWTS
jgi:hypothetical protein